MNLSAIVRGALAGAATALLLALIIAAVVYNTSMPDEVLAIGIWVADALSSLMAGFMAARRLESGAALHGLLAALTLSIVGNLLAELTRWPIGSLWMQLSLAAVMGVTGGLLGVMF